MKTIGIVGEFDPNFAPHTATNHGIEHSRQALGLEIDFEWVSAADIEPTFFERFASLWVAPGSPYKDLNRTLQLIRQARECRIPTFGTCGGFQHILLEYARHELGLTEATHAEYDPYAADLFISSLACSLAGREMTLNLHPRSRVAQIYASLQSTEQYYCNFSLNPEYVDAIRKSNLIISGSDSEGEVRIVELSDHPFYLATLFVPQARSTPTKPHPLVNAFLAATAESAPQLQT